MIYKTTAYYIIRPKNLLYETFKQYQQHDNLYFMRPFILTREEYENSHELDASHIEETKEAKLTFLLDLVGWKDYISDLFQEMFGKPVSFTESSFDKWWTIERIDYEKHSNTIYDMANEEKLSSLDSDGDEAVEKWIQMMKNGGYKAMQEELDQIIKRSIKGK